MRKVLLVNDSKFESMVLKDTLSSMGFDVRLADEYNTLGFIDDFHPNYVIVNYIMKEIRGDQLIGLIKLKNPSISCILSSSGHINLDGLVHKKVDGVFQTPVDGVKLESLLKDINKKRNALGELTSEKNSTRTTDMKLSEGIELSVNAVNADQVEREQKHNMSSVRSLRFCPYCGQRLSEGPEKNVMFCPYCGEKL